MTDSEIDQALSHPDTCLCPLCGDLVAHEIEEAVLDDVRTLEQEKALLAEAPTRAEREEQERLRLRGKVELVWEALLLRPDVLSLSQEQREKVRSSMHERVKPGLAERNIWYLKDKMFLSPADRYYLKRNGIVMPAGLGQ